MVIDTCILVSGLLNPQGPPARVLDLVLIRDLTPVFDDRMMAEYAEVLARPAFCFESAAAAALLDLWRRVGDSAVTSPMKHDLPDPDDLPFAEVAAQALCDYLITGNKGHFPRKSFPGKAGAGREGRVAGRAPFPYRLIP